ncbi:MAG: glycoside hydrolase family 9 protein, partial [Bacteroidota bacterium]
MKNLILPLLGMGLLALLGPGCLSPQGPRADQGTQSILLNQLGYPTFGNKKALLRGPAQVFQLKAQTGEVVFQDSAATPRYWELSGDSVRVADFSDFTQEGTYTLCTKDGTCSKPFAIEDSLYYAAADAALKSYFYARCSEGVSETHGGKWHRKAGHPDTAVLVHSSAASSTRPAGLTLSLPGGWYDAGDYGKYVVNSSITTWTLLQSLQSNLTFHQGQSLNIPESGNELPDVLDEALVNLRWMLSMQDPQDGGVYHKLTTEKFDSFILPEETQATRYLFAKSTAATLDFAATMATASRVLQDFPVADLAKQTQRSAEKAWRWALQHPEDMFQNPEGVNTGMYPDTSLVDEWFWVAA